MFVLTPAPDGTFARTDFAQGFGAYGLIDMVFGPSGADRALYYINWSAPGQEIHRIVYTGTPRGYARPKGATPLRVPLVPAFDAASAPNRTHGAPLAYGSCARPPSPRAMLTVGTPDANGKAASSTGSALVRRDRWATPRRPPTRPTSPWQLSVTDVRRRSRPRRLHGPAPGAAPRCGSPTRTTAA